MSVEDTIPAEHVESEPHADAVPDLRTLQGLMQQTRADETSRETVTIPIPGWERDLPGYGRFRLCGVFRALDDYREARRIELRHQHVRDQATRELEIGAETLVAASVTTVLQADGRDDIPLEMPVGTQLGRWLGVIEDGDAVSDIEAVFMIFPNTLKLATVVAEITELSQGASKRADEELAKN